MCVCTLAPCLEAISAGVYIKVVVELLSTLNEHPQTRPPRHFDNLDETLVNYAWNCCKFL